MASSSGVDARLEDLDRLTERALEEKASGRFALATTLFSRADALASQLHNDTCLVQAWLRYYHASSLCEQGVLAREAAKRTPREDGVTQEAGREDASFKEASALTAQGWELLQSVIAMLERRAAAGTTVRERGVRLLEFPLSRGSSLLHPVAEVSHVPHRGGGVV